MTLLNQFMEFAGSNLKEPMFGINGSLNLRNADIEQAGGFIFDYVDLEEKFVDEEKKVHVAEHDFVRIVKNMS